MATTRTTPPTQPPRSRRRLRALTALAAATTAVALAGCSIQITSSPDPSIGADTMLINADKGSPLFERNFNPYLANKRVAASYVYEPLLFTNVLDGSITPWLASAYDQPDARTIDMTIRDDVEWSDGEPFTADDVAFTFDLLREHPALDVRGAWTHIDRIEVEGDHVVFHLESDDAPSISIIGVTLMVPEHLWSGVDDPATFRDPDPVGTGPFVLGNYTAQQYTMDKNPTYWQADDVEVEHLVLPATNDQLDTVTRGYDWAYSFISDVEGTWGAANPDNTFWFPPGGVIGLIPNLTKAPFDDVHLRRGISLALDRDRIADTATEGYLEAASQTGLILPNQEEYLDPSLPDGGMVVQDRDAALAEFTQAGYELRDGELVDADGRQLSFSITTANGYSDWLRAVQEVRRQLGGIGIDVQVQAPQPAGYQSAINNGDFDVAMGGMGNGDVFQAYNNLLSSEFYQPVGESTQNNFERFSDPAVDELLSEYRSTVDEAEQRELIVELQNVVHDQLPVIGMYHGGLWGLFNTSKFTGWPSADDPYTAPQTYDWAPLMIFTRLERVDAEGGDDE